jgi:hypothetical protein
MKSTGYNIPHYVSLSIILLLPFSWFIHPRQLFFLQQPQSMFSF